MKAGKDRPAGADRPALETDDFGAELTPGLRGQEERLRAQVKAKTKG